LTVLGTLYTFAFPPLVIFDCITRLAESLTPAMSASGDAQSGSRISNFRDGVRHSSVMNDRLSP
jgi:hypothetical protein